MLSFEPVAKELGMYENDPFADLGRLQAALFRVLRLVVDTGMHHKRWNREEAKATLGDKFDLSAFHDEVLLSGAVPMAVLDTNIKAWVETQK
jgi:uncharacterized protein (DUF885 family)